MVPLGIMVSLRDFKILRVPGVQFSELLLFDGDIHSMELETVGELMSKSNAKISYVHVQEYVKFQGEQRLLDLASEDESFRIFCVKIVDRTRELAESIGSHVVLHPGGIRDRAVGNRKLLSRLKKSLSELGPDRLLLENMPWFYWLRSGSLYVSNICVTIQDIESVQDMVEGFTLDSSHGYLSRKEGDHDFMQRMLDAVGMKVLHVHLSDAIAPHTEGLQIGDGEVDFTFMKRLHVPTLVEIWKGHEGGGSGFKIGIERFRMMESKWRLRNGSPVPNSHEESKTTNLQ